MLEKAKRFIKKASWNVDISRSKLNFYFVILHLFNKYFTVSFTRLILTNPHKKYSVFRNILIFLSIIDFCERKMKISGVKQSSNKTNCGRTFQWNVKFNEVFKEHLYDCCTRLKIMHLFRIPLIPAILKRWCVI